jgi:hypothetical protein
MTTFTGTIPTIASGDTTTVPTNLATYRDALKAATEAWTSFGSGSSWTATTTNPTLGNGTWVGHYRQLDKTVDFWIRITVGSTTTAGSGIYQVTLPVTPIAGHPCRFGVAFSDASASATYFGMTAFVSGAKVNLLYHSSAAGGALGAVGNTTPAAPATGDTYDVWGSYEAA